MASHAFLDYTCFGADGNIHYIMNDMTKDDAKSFVMTSFGLTEDEFIDVTDMIKSNTFPCCPYTELMHYSIENGQMVFSKEKARTNFTDKMRIERNRELSKLDAEYMKALENGSDTSTIIAKKRVLRNMPVHPIWDACVTLDDFKNLTLEATLSTSTQ
jgi:hypothetical protein